jgi:hypothetical protein
MNDSPEGFDPGWIFEGDRGEAYDLSRITGIIQDRLDHYPDQTEKDRWVTQHPGVNLRPVEGVAGAFTMFLYDGANNLEFVFGEFHRDDLLA